MTDRLYYVNPAEKEFDATVVAVERAGGRVVVRLDRTAFYPTSGGQPFDTGSLGPSKVVDVFDETGGPDGDVLHAIEGESPAPGQLVRGRIDWQRRFDHMQQHTGQHVLSAAFDALFDTQTVSFHMGAGTSTIDLAREMSAEQLTVAENEANRIVWENRAVAIRFVTDAQAAELPLRKPPKKSGTIRLIDIDGWDLSACGGTHVATTGAVGVIAVGGWERFKGGTRVEFVCGGRALEWMRSLRDASAAAARVLSTSVQDLPQSIERLLAEEKEQRRGLTTAQHELARFRGAELAAAAAATAHGRFVVQAVDADAAGLKALASATTSHAGVGAVLVSTSSPAVIVVARAADLTIRSNDVLAALVAKFGGRGGGKPDLAQGGGLNGSAEDILAEARRLIAGA